MKVGKDIFVEYKLRTPKLAEFVVAAKEDLTKLLSRLSGIAEKYNVSIVELNASDMGVEKTVFFFADFQKALVEPYEFLAELRGMGVKVNMSTKSYKGYIVDQFGFPVTTGGGIFRVVVFPADLLSRTFNNIKERLGTPGETILYHLGVEYGKVMFSGQLPLVENDKKAALLSLLDLYASFGMGIVEIAEADWREGRFRVRIHECYEALNGKGCDFTRGFLAGVFGEFAGRELQVLETKCASTGEPFCEFVVE